MRDISVEKQAELMDLLDELTDRELAWLENTGIHQERRTRQSLRRQQGYGAERQVWQAVESALPAAARRGLEIGKATSRRDAQDALYGVLLITPKNTASRQAPGFIERAYAILAVLNERAGHKVEMVGLTSYTAIRVQVAYTEGA